MNNEKKTEIKVGLTVFAALLIFIVVYGWAKNFSFNSEAMDLKVNFTTVAGLELGDLVSVNGVKKGFVKDIQSGDNSALVTIKFNNPVDLRNDAKFSIMMLDLMGGKKIEINSGTSPNIIDYSKVYSGQFSGDISTAMATLSSVETDLVEVIRELKLSLESMNSIFKSDSFINDLKMSASNLNMLSKNMNELLITNRANINQIVNSSKNLLENSNQFLSDNKDSFSSLVENMDSTISNSNKLIVKLNKVSDEILSSENNIGKLLYDEQLFDDLAQSIKDIKELTSIINKQLKSGGLEVKADVDLF